MESINAESPLWDCDCVYNVTFYIFNLNLTVKYSFICSNTNYPIVGSFLGMHDIALNQGGSREQFLQYWHG